MNKKIHIGEYLEDLQVLLPFSLGFLATSLSIFVSAYVGWQMGVSQIEKLICAGGGVLAVLGAHLFPALCRPVAIRWLLVAALVWLACMAYVYRSHASFFLSTQQEAGMRRAEAVILPSLNMTPARTLATVLSAQEKIETELALKSRLSCIEGCLMLKVKLTSLKGKLDALKAEADEVRRWRAEQDRHEAIQDAVRDDPVTVRLADWLHVTNSQMGTVTSFLFFLVLEGTGVYCWYLVCQRRDSTVNQSVKSMVTAITEVTKVDTSDVTLPLSDLEKKAEEVLREFKAAGIKVTVRNIQPYFSCAQREATEIRRLVAAKLNPGTIAC